MCLKIVIVRFVRRIPSAISVPPLNLNSSICIHNEGMNFSSTHTKGELSVATLQPWRWPITTRVPRSEPWFDFSFQMSILNVQNKKKKKKKGPNFLHSDSQLEYFKFVLPNLLKILFNMVVSLISHKAQ